MDGKEIPTTRLGFYGHLLKQPGAVIVAVLTFVATVVALLPLALTDEQIAGYLPLPPWGFVVIGILLALIAGAILLETAFRAVERVRGQYDEPLEIMVDRGQGSTPTADPLRAVHVGRIYAASLNEAERRVEASFEVFNGSDVQVHLQVVNTQVKYGDDRLLGLVEVSAQPKEIPPFSAANVGIIVRLVGEAGNHVLADAVEARKEPKGKLPPIDMSGIQIDVVAGSQRRRLKTPDGTLFYREDGWFYGQLVNVFAAFR